MSVDKSEYETALEVVSRFVWFSGVSGPLEVANRACGRLQPPLSSIGSSFIRTMRSLHSVCSFVYLQTVVFVQERSLQPLELAALIEADAHYGALTVEEENGIRTQVREKYLSENRTKIFRIATIELHKMLSTGEIYREYCEEIEKSAIVLLWSGIEVFLKDFLIALMNETPRLTVTVMRDQELSRLLQSKSISPDVLQQYGFDLSSNMGSACFDDKDFSSVPFVRALFGALLGKSSAFYLAIKDQKLWQ